jgi:hypothetical protein
MLLPLSVVVMSGGTAVIMLVWFFWAVGGLETLAAALMSNVRRTSPAFMSMPDVARAAMATAWECAGTLGGAVLLLAAVAMFVERRHRGLLVLLACYVGWTIAFNLIMFRLPGAGTSYLDSAVPALALLAGTSAARLVELATTPTTRTLVASSAIAIQIAGSLSLYERPRPNGSRVAAAYIAAHDPRTSGVLADTVAIEFYSGHPVRAVPFTYPRELVLRSLEGRSGEDISFVVVDPSSAHRNLDAVRQQWNTLLGEHFELVAAGAPGLHVYRRRGPVTHTGLVDR